MKYRFMNEHRHEHTVSLMCRVLQVARAGFYAWLHRPMSDHAKEDERLLELIRHSYVGSHGVYGARRVFGDLREAGEQCGLHRVERLMSRYKIKAVRGYKSPRRIAGRPSLIAPNHLQREFTVDSANKVWVTDITLYLGNVAGCQRRSKSDPPYRCNAEVNLTHPGLWLLGSSAEGEARNGRTKWLVFTALLRPSWPHDRPCVCP